MLKLDALLAISSPPIYKPISWLEGAADAVDFTVANAGSEEIILLSTCGQLITNTALTPLENVTPPDFGDLERCDLWSGEWAIEHCSGGGKPDRVYLSPPLENFGTRSLNGGEKLVFRRSFSGVDRGQVQTELSQKLVQALGLYWLKEESAYCRLDEDGDVERVIRVRDMRKHTGKDDTLVTILAEPLHRFMAATEMALVIKFDATRYADGFSGWYNTIRNAFREGDLSHQSGKQTGASFTSGTVIVRPLLNKEILIQEFQRDREGTDKQYAVFKAQDWKNQRLAEVSCAPSVLASYFDKNSSLPFQTTPAFFKPEVLQRYKQDSEKYTLEHHSVASRAGWSLKSYDLNEAGQVHAYLCDLAQLPYREQLYWQSFNEWPKAAISRRAFQTDFEGRYSDIPDPLLELKAEIRKLDENPPDWWQPRGEDAERAVHYPITASPDEWANAVLALDQLLVEGFLPAALRALLTQAGRKFDKQWASLRLLQEYLVAGGLAEDDVISTLEPLKRIHALRTKVRGHLSQGERQAHIRQARTEHGSLAAHFRAQTIDLQVSFNRIVQLL